MVINYKDIIIDLIQNSINKVDEAFLYLENINIDNSDSTSLEEKRELVNKKLIQLEEYYNLKLSLDNILDKAKQLPIVSKNIIDSKNDYIVNREPIVFIGDYDSSMSDDNYNNLDLTYTVVDKVIFCGVNYYPKIWRKVMTTIVEHVIKDKNLTSKNLIENMNFFGKNGPIFSLDKNKLRRDKKLSNDCLIEVNMSAKQIYQFVYKFISEYGYDLSDLEILYTKKENSKSNNKNYDFDKEKINKAFYQSKDFTKEMLDDPIKLLEKLEDL